MEYYSAVKMNKLIPHTKEYPNIMLTDKPDIKEWILYNFIYICQEKAKQRQNFLRLRSSRKFKKQSMVAWVWRVVFYVWT